MVTRSASDSTLIEVNKPEVTGSGWGKVAGLAVVGFAVGVFWPRLLGMRPGPSAPPEAIAAISTSAPAATPPAAAPAVPATQTPATPSLAVAPHPPPTVPTPSAVPTPVASAAAVIAAPQARPSTPPPATEEATGSAQIVWEVGMVRESPHKGAGLISRLPKGAEVHLGAVKGGWYEVHYGANFKNHGWLFGGAIGREAAESTR